MHLRIIAPCPVDFRAMRDDGEARFCDVCQKHVYDLTCLSAEEVRAFVSQRGRICARVAAAAIALTGCSAADQATQPMVQIGPIAQPPPKPDAGAVIDEEPMMGEIEITR